MSTDRNIDRIVRSWLREDRHEDADRVLDTVLTELDATPQRRLSWAARRFPIMNNALRVGLVAAAVVIIAVIAINLLPGSPAPGGEPTPSPSAAALATPEPTPLAFAIAIPELAGSQIVLTLPSGWAPGTGWYVTDRSIFLGVYPVESVYGDPCHWQGSLPDPQVGPTVDDFATALANQPTREGIVTDVTLDGYSGKKVTLSTPADINFADCDLGMFGTWTETGSDEPSRYSQGPGQVEDVYIIDVDGVRLVLDASWFPDQATPDELAELATVISSMDIQP